MPISAQQLYSLHADYVPLHSDSLQEEGPDDHHFISQHMQYIATCIFTSNASVCRLREESRLRTKCTPEGTSWRLFRDGIHATGGVSAEALALTLWYLAQHEGLSASDVERYRDVAEYTWHTWYEDETDDESWHKDEDSFVGNPATSPVVSRAIRLAYEISDRRLAAGQSAGSVGPSQAAYREAVRRQSAPAPYLDLD